MRICSTFVAGLVAAATFVAPLAAQNVTFSGNGYASGYGAFSFSFLLPQSPTVDHADSFEHSFTLDNQTATVDFGGSLFSYPADLKFFADATCGGFNIFVSSSPVADVCGDGGAQMFTGSVDAPTFTPGYYGDLNNLYGSILPVELTDVTISSTTTTPEPSSMALIGTGLFGLIPMVRRRKK